MRGKNKLSSIAVLRTPGNGLVGDLIQDSIQSKPIAKIEIVRKIKSRTDLKKIKEQ